MDLLAEVEKCASEKHPRVRDIHISYGTAGFRTKSCELDHVIFRMGMLAVLASRSRKATIGVMITASHNPEEDNGVKLVDQHGEMMPPQWEEYATQLANVSDSEITACLKKIIDAESLDMSQPAKVVHAQDTRASSGPLAQALADGIQALGGEATNYGLLTTPQLHYMVVCINTQGQYGEPSEQGYVQKLSQAFLQLVSLAGSAAGNYTNVLSLDAANGVGAPKMAAMLERLKDALSVHLVNDGSSGKLNYQCGADFVKIQQTFPVGLEAKPGERCASFDGDADRIVYFYKDDNGKFNLLDGDKIATLVAGYLQELLTASGLQLNLGLVQTAYANGSSTRYITQELKVPVACVPTGVKYLHHKAQEYDIGVYFEANGHGTVLFSKEAMAKVRAAAQDASLPDEKKKAAQSLATMTDLINQTVGDAISDLLVVETVLRVRGWSVADWNNAYTDLPNRQLKVKVADRNVVQTADAERKVVSPDGLQAAIDKLVTDFPHGRSFVRPSGTEDVVRVYAEADTQEHADKLARAVAGEVYRLAGGVGEKPADP